MKSEIKPIYGLERVILSDVIPLDTPFSVFVFPTTFCNFRCIYCAHSLGTDRMKEQYGLSKETMSMDTYRKVMEQLQGFPRKIKMLSLTGQGEPLLHRDLPVMIKMAKEMQVAERVEFITNGALLTPELSDRLIDSGIDTIRISVQGLTSEKYEEMCGNPVNFDEFVANIAYFYEHKKHTDLFVKIMDASLSPGEDQEFYKIFGNISDRMYVERLLPAYDGVELTQGMNVSYDRYGREAKRRDVCPLPFYMMGVFPNGDVEPCDTIYKPIVLGNVHTKTLTDMWNGEELNQFRLQQLRGERYSNPKCSVCCAPNDVSHPEDVLDSHSQQLIARLMERR